MYAYYIIIYISYAHKVDWVTLSFLRNDVLLNLFHQFQVDNYLKKCKLFM